MAEKITLAEIDLNIDSATKDAKALKETIDLLKSEMKKAAEESGKNSKEYIELQAGLKLANKEYNQQINLIGKSVQADTAKAGSIEQQRALLSVVTQQWAELSEEERKNSDRGKALTKQKKELTEGLLKEEKATGNAARQVGFYERNMQDANAATATFIPGAGKAAGAAKGLGVALKVMLGPIGLIIAAIGAVVGAFKSFFTSSEEGQNRLKKFQAIFQTVFGNIIDIASKLGEALTNAVTKPREAWENFKNFIKGIGDFFENTFGKSIKGSFEVFTGTLQKGFAKIGLAWQKLKNLFTDNAEGIEKSQKKIQDANEKITEGYEKVAEADKNLRDSASRTWKRLKDGVTDYIAEQEREIAIAKRLADLQSGIDKEVRKNLVLEAQDRLKLEQLKNKVELKNQTTAEERIALLEEEGEILDKILARNLKIAKQRLFIREEQNKLSNSTKEDLQEEAQLRADIFNIETQIETQRREAITKRQEAEREIIAAAQAQADEQIRILEETIERQREIEEEERLRKIDQATLDFENEYAIAEGNLFAQLDLERQYLEKQREQEIAFANKIGADVAKVNAKYAKAQRALDVAEFNAKISLAAGFTQNLATIAGEQTAIGKAAAVASATISTIQGAVNSFTSLSSIPVVGPALGAAAAAAALVAGYAQVKEILSVKSGLPGEGNVSASAPTGGASNAPNIPVSTAPRETTAGSVGQGIVSRDTQDQSSAAVANGVSAAFEENLLQPTLVTDDVTVKQDEALSSNQTSTL